MEIVETCELEGVKVRIIRGDITDAEVDAIVNAANSYLKHGGGVAGAIVRKGGSIIQEESNRIGYVPVGECAVTGAGALKAKIIIHTVGPRWGEGNEEEKLMKAIRNTLKTAKERNLNSIAMPAISAGIFGFPKDRCAEIIISEIVDFIKKEKPSFERIDIYLLDEEIIRFFEREISKIKG